MLQIKNGDKFYIITRRDLSQGVQAAQTIHAAIQFCVEHPAEFKNWFQNSNYVCVLAVKDEKELLELYNNAKYKVKCSMFKEPDLRQELTAIVLECCDESKKLCRKLKLLQPAIV